MTNTAKDFCFSPISGVRCQGLSELQYIGTYIPIGIQVLALPVVLMTIWSIPKLTLILLTIEIGLNISITTWDLAVSLSPPRLDTFQTEVTVLALISPLPLLFFHLTLTSYLLELRPTLPAPLQSRRTIIIFGTLFAPLLPISLVAGILPSFLSLNYFRMRRGEVFIRFSKISDERLFDIFLYVGSISSMIYTLLMGVLAYLSRWEHRSDRKRNKVIYILVAGMILSSVEIGLSLLPSQRFSILLARRTIHLLSRVCLVLGYIVWYRLEAISNSGSTPRRKQKGRDTINTFGTPASTFGLNLNLNNPLIQRKATSATRKSSMKRRVGKLQIGNPIEGSFQKLNTGLGDGLPSAKLGMGIIGGQVAGVGVGSPVFVGVDRGGRVEKVVVKRPTKRPPILSFTPSTFTQSSLNALISSIAPSRDPVRNTEMVPPGTALSRSTTSAKKNVGSIYRPERVIVEESDLAVWPPSRMIERSDFYDRSQYDEVQRKVGPGQIHRQPVDNTSLVEDPRLLNEILPTRLLARPPLQPRSNSIKRKAVPLIDVEPTKRISNYFTSLKSPPRRQAPLHQAQVQAQAQAGRLSVQPEIEQLNGTGKARVRSGTATERVIWFSPPRARDQTETDPKDRPSMIYRRSTDPSQAIYPSPTASSTLEGPSYSPSPRSRPISQSTAAEGRGQTTNEDGPTHQNNHNQNQYSITSMYSTNQTIHTYSSSINRDLFYNPPRRSTSIESRLTASPTKSTTTPLDPQVPVPVPGSASELSPDPGSPASISADHKMRQSELQTVLARLTKLRRETGFNSDFGLDLSVRDEDSFVYDLEDMDMREYKSWTKGDERRSLGSEITFDSEISENLTPVAEIRLINSGRRNYGGVV
ncbi:hypothetical protein I302_102917 [Kwoniella bestiolae CBS 10118]|uniref:Uncharacterized protein n=1 Tax=Kwoniella bestiolae CBS 10118 TaxID=1296100 RepID=A0A1B9GGB0_9TREE|nr:hypothetical protein I302_01613 [Kwoniella bestiolae CBS 10118]OCF30094.1 hypothetical protein I302_01613 [Kwoniella bestiolae CBS 10118]